MLNSKTTSMNGIFKFIKKILAVLVIAAAVNFAFFDNVHSYTRVMLHEMYEEDSIDILFLGASHVYRGIDPHIADRMLGCCTFNGSTSSQLMEGSWYVLNEAVKENNIKKVFLDVSYGTNTGDGGVGTTYPTYLISDYMKNSRDRFHYIWSTQKIDGIINTVFPVLHTSSLPSEIFPEKIMPDFWNYQYSYITYDNEAYKGKGFVYSYETNTEKHYYGRDDLDEDLLFSEFSREWLIRIIQLCENYNIQLVLIDCPMPDALLSGTKLFQNYIDTIELIAEEHGVLYWDFNLCKKGILTMDYSDYSDSVHLNGTGATRFTEVLCEMIQNRFDDPFYDTYNEKLQENPDGTMNHHK